MRTLLVAIDGSEASSRALEFAARQAEGKADVRLHLLYVRAPLRVYGEIEVYATVEHMRELATRAAAVILGDARKRVADRLSTIETEQLEGDPGETIVQRASELGCESIIMGTHGRGRLGTAVLGSVAYKVVHLSSVPVTLIR